MTNNNNNIILKTETTEVNKPALTHASIAEFLDKSDLKALETYNIMITSYMKAQKSVADSIAFRLRSKYDLEIKYFNSYRVLSDGSTRKLADGESQAVDTYLIKLDNSAYNASQRMNELNDRDETREDFMSKEKIEQYYKPLIGQLLNHFKERAMNGNKFDENFIKIKFQNFHIFASAMLEKVVVKYIADEGRITGGRSNGKIYEIKIHPKDDPIYEITYTDPNK